MSEAAPMSRLADPNMQLPPPSVACDDAQSLEVLRGWTDPRGEMHIALRLAWEDPGAFGVLLVDIARRAAEAYQEQGVDPTQALERIRSVLDAQWPSPAPASEPIIEEPMSFGATYRLAEQGDADSQLVVANAYLERDEHEAAMHWFQTSANLGNAVAQYTLAEMFRNAPGLAQDSTKALKYHVLAAEQGYPAALYSAGVMFATGEGTPQDLVTAYFWLSHAAATGIEGGAETLDWVRGNMSPEQVEAAEAPLRAAR